MPNKPQPPKSPFNLGNAFLLAVIGVGAFAYFQNNDEQKAMAAEAIQKSQMVPYTDFAAKVHKKLIKRIDVRPDGKLIGVAPGEAPVLSQQLPGDNLAARLDEEIKSGDVTINVVPPPKVEASSGGGGGTGWTGLIVMILAMSAISIGFQMFMQRRRQGGGNNLGGFGKSKARMQDANTADVTFVDVAGCDEAKEQVEEIVEFLKDPKKFSRLGGRIPHGALLVGPPGTGKTLLAKAVAGEAKVPFFSISGSDFVEMFVGVGAARVRDMFETAKKHAPCIVFIDEIDGVGKHRGNGMGGGGNDEREQTLNALLVEMDGFGADSGVIVIAATNRVDTLDKALLRPGRFDRQVYVGLPDINGREQILKVHSRKVPLGSDIQLLSLARGTPGMSGADLANLVNEAALVAARRNARTVEMRDFEKAKDDIFMGPERKSMVMSIEERTNTGKHESGHTIIGKLVPGNDPVHKVTIMPRGRALGLTWSQPETDRYGYTHRQMLANITMLYGGRIAEELHANGDMLSVSTGASNDIMRATQMAKEMVTRYGFHDPDSERPLSVAFYAADDNGQYMINSMEAHNAVGKQVEKILNKCEAEARKILLENVHIMDQMTKDLLEYETLDAEDINMIMRGESITEKKQKEHQRLIANTRETGSDRFGQNLANDNKPSRPEPRKFDMK